METSWDARVLELVSRCVALSQLYDLTIAKKVSTWRGHYVEYANEINYATYPQAWCGLDRR